MGGPLATPFESGDVIDPLDVATARAAAQDPGARASDALAANPQLINDPAGAKAILSQPNADGHTTGQASKFISAYGGVHKAVQATAQSDNPHAGGWLSSLWHGATSLWDGVANAVTPSALGHDISEANPFNMVNEPAGQERSQAIVKSTEGLAEAIKHGAKNFGEMATRLGSFGQVNPSDLSNQNPDLKENYGEGVDTLVKGLNSTVNPFTVYRNMAHTIAFTESLAKRKGWGVALSTMVPYFVAAMATHTAFVGEGAVDAGVVNEASEAAGEVTKAVQEAEAEGVKLTPEEELAQKEAQNIQGGPSGATPKVVGTFEPRDGEPVEAEVGAQTAERAGRGPVFRAASKVAGTVSKPLAAVTKVAHVVGAPTQDLTLNAMYQLAGAGIMQNPELAPLWQTTANGVPVDENGNPMGSVGSNIASYIGLPAGGLAAAIADPINIYANYLGSDPLGAVGRTVGLARTFDSTGGLVGHFFGGMGIRTPDDVYRVADQYARVGRAFDWMANHSAGEINDAFRGLFIGKGGREVLDLLGKADTREEVQKIWADMSQGIGFVHNVAPSMSFYQLTKASFKYGDKAFTVGDSLAGTADELRAEAKDIEDQTGIKVSPPDSTNDAVIEGPVAARVRTRTIAAKMFAKMFTQRESYFNEATGKLENLTMHTGSTQLTNAIGDQLRALGEEPATIAMAQDQLLHATPDEYNQLVLNIYHDTTMKLFYANTKYSVLDQVKGQVESDLRKQLLSMMGTDGAGEKGVMVNGEKGQLMSAVPDSAGGGAINAGIGETHLGVLHFPRTRDLKGYAKFVGRIADEFSHAQDGMLGVDDHLSEEALQRKAAFADSSLRGLPSDIEAKIGTLGGDHELLGLSQEGYDSKLRELSGEIRRSLSSVQDGDTIGHNRAFVDTFTAVRQNLSDTKRIVQLVDKWNMSARDLREGSDTYNAILRDLNSKLPAGIVDDVRNVSPETQARLRGELSALQDTGAEMKARLQKNAITMKELEAHIEGRDPGMTREARKALASNLQDLRERNPRYRNMWQHFIDGANYYTSKIFTPLALYSGGWAVRVGNSEMLQNTFREGGMKMFQSKLLTSYLKHETGRANFTSRMDGWLERHISSDLFRGSMGDMLKRSDLSYSKKLVGATVRTAGGLVLGMRDVAGGTLHGIEGNLINWTPRTERMVDRVMGALYDYAPGGLPMGVHSGGGILADDAMREHLLYGEDENGKSVMSTVSHNRTFSSVNPGDKSYYRGLRSSLTRIHDDSYLAPAMKKLDEMLPTLPERLDDEDVSRVIDELTQTSLANIESKPESELERFVRSTKKGKMALEDHEVFSSLSDAQKARASAMSADAQEKFYARYDWARTIAYHDLHTVLGTVGDGEYVIHDSLVHQAASGEVKSMSDLRKEIDAMPNRTEPQNIVAENFQHESAQGITQRIARMMNVPQEVSNAGFHNLLGPMVNSYVRDPVYLSIYDDEMEKLQNMVDENLISEDTQKIRAHTNSTIKMSQFVHNPQDRTLFESNMRAFAPFYFAQNQAWRRALRMASQDPGAFEKYLRMSLAVTDFVSVKGQNGASSVYIPSSQFMGAVAGMGSGLFPEQLGSLGFSLAGSVGSVSSVIPTGSEAGLGVLENIVRPSWGALVNVPLKLVEHYAGLENVPAANKMVKGLLGPAGANTSMLDEILPTSIGRSLVNLTEGALNIQNSSFASAEIYTLNNSVDNLATQYYDSNMSALLSAGLPRTVAADLARARTDQQVSQFFDVNTNHKQIQEFMDHVHASAVFMYAVKTGLGFFSPVSLSLQATFSKDPEFQKLLNEKVTVNGKRQAKYTYAEAATVFAQKFPTRIYDLVAHSKPVGSDFAETTSAMNLIENHPYVVSKYANAAAYLINRDTSYSPTAYQLELQLGLRSKYTNFSGGSSGLGDYMDALLTANGNDYYYNYLKPLYPDGAGTQGYDNYKKLTAAAENFGRTINPTWWGNFQSGQGKWATESSAVTQMQQMLNDPNVPDTVYGGADNKILYRVFMGLYNTTVEQYDDASTSTQKYDIESEWYNKMSAIGSSTSVNPALAYFITSVLRNLPTATK